MDQGTCVENEMVIEYLGQACIMVRVGEVRLLCDPWFAGAAHLDGWIPFPAPSAERLAELVALADDATHIYISHAHEDHFDPQLLAKLSRKQLIVGDFKSTRFREALDDLRRYHDVVFVPDDTPHLLGPGVVARIHVEKPRFRTNSVLELSTPHGTVVNANDCGLDTSLLHAIAARGHPTVFWYTLNFMANGYPFPYLRRTQPDLRKVINATRDDIVSSFRRAMEILHPTLSLAFAGPVTFADGDINAHLNAYPEARDWTELVKELMDTGPVAWPAPGSRLHVGLGVPTWSELRSWTPLLRDPSKQLCANVDRWRSTELVDDDAFNRSVDEFVATRSQLARRLGAQIGIKLILSAARSIEVLEGDDRFLWHEVIHLDQPASHTRLDGCRMPEPPWLQIISTPTILWNFLQGKVDLDALLLSGRARFSRRPDQFHSTLHNILRFGHDPGAVNALVEWTDAQRNSKGELMTVVVDGHTHQVPRYCPHEGEDLRGAPLKDGCIICPRHKWRFKVETGECIVGARQVKLFQRDKV